MIEARWLDGNRRLKRDWFFDERGRPKDRAIAAGCFAPGGHFIAAVLPHVVPIMYGEPNEDLFQKAEEWLRENTIGCWDFFVWSSFYNGFFFENPDDATLFKLDFIIRHDVPRPW